MYCFVISLVFVLCCCDWIVVGALIFQHIQSVCISCNLIAGKCVNPSIGGQPPTGGFACQHVAEIMRYCVADVCGMFLPLYFGAYVCG